MADERADSQARRDQIKGWLREILRYLGEDPDREGLKGTPDRILRAWDEIFRGYQSSAGDILSTTFNETGGYTGMVISRDIAFVSTCEHHFMPFSGVAHVGYLPSNKVVGLSKLARLVDHHACRLQVQERMTESIADDLFKILSPYGAGVVIEATHHCMSCRGVKKPGSTMVTSSVRGDMATDPAVKSEFLSFTRSR